MTSVSTWLEAFLSVALFIPLHGVRKPARRREGDRGGASGRSPEATPDPREELRMRDDFRLSVLVPFREEGRTFPGLYRRLRTVLDGVVGGPHEIVLIDVDRRRAPLELPGDVRRDPGVVVVRPGGETVEEAVAAGLIHVVGDAAVVMAGDLRHPPEAIGGLLEKCREGHDLICAATERPELPWWCWLVRRLRARLSVVDAPRWRRFSLLSSGALDDLRRTPDPEHALQRLKDGSSDPAGLSRICITADDAVQQGAASGKGRP